MLYNIIMFFKNENLMCYVTLYTLFGICENTFFSSSVKYFKMMNYTNKVYMIMNMHMVVVISVALIDVIVAWLFGMMLMKLLDEYLVDKNSICGVSIHPWSML